MLRALKQQVGETSVRELRMATEVFAAGREDRPFASEGRNVRFNLLRVKASVEQPEGPRGEADKQTEEEETAVL